MMIRDAVPADAARVCEVIRASIIVLCVADHNQNPEILGRWLAGKTPENVVAWIAHAGSSLLVAVGDDDILAAGGVTDDGEITLNYVAPQARFRGLSTLLLGALEARAVERGAIRITLLSTETAHRFYLSRGYRNVGSPQRKLGTASSYPMTKLLSTPVS
jgi:GNAT superfamily N-acetyltransferase